MITGKINSRFKITTNAPTMCVRLKDNNLIISYIVVHLNTHADEIIYQKIKIYNRMDYY